VGVVVHGDGERGGSAIYRLEEGSGGSNMLHHTTCECDQMYGQRPVTTEADVPYLHNVRA
jgi:hypothetical protein